MITIFVFESKNLLLQLRIVSIWDVGLFRFGILDLGFRIWGIYKDSYLINTMSLVPCALRLAPLPFYLPPYTLYLFVTSDQLVDINLFFL